MKKHFILAEAKDTLKVSTHTYYIEKITFPLFAFRNGVEKISCLIGFCQAGPGGGVVQTVKNFLFRKTHKWWVRVNFSFIYIALCTFLRDPV